MGTKVSVVAVPDCVFANICIEFWKDLREVIFQEQEKCCSLVLFSSNMPIITSTS